MEQIAYYAKEYETRPIDRTTVDQGLLDLGANRNHNMFSYRGQFSPDFVSALLRLFVRPGYTVVDPFVGCGTTVFAAAQTGVSAVGTDINPGAVLMAQTCMFIPLKKHDRLTVVERCRSIAESNIPSAGTLIAAPVTDDECQAGPLEEIIASVVLRHRDDPFVFNILANTLMLMLKRSSQPTVHDFWVSFEKHCRLVLNLPVVDRQYEVYQCDARALPVSSSSIDLILTSPPYVNVFNYHQQNRRALELLGWDMLQTARSEFGANRKYRSNRFLTIVQYILDMADALKEMHRVLRPGGRAIIVVGRESTVRGVRVRNDLILALLGQLGGFHLERHQERKFKNQFGTVIYEDILHFIPISKSAGLDKTTCATDIARWLLWELKDAAGRAGAERDLTNAIDAVDTVEPSALLRTSSATQDVAWA